MQRLICRKLASDLTRKLSDKSHGPLHSQNHTIFSSLGKPSQCHNQVQNQNFTAFFSYPFSQPHSYCSNRQLHGKIRGFLSNPVLAKKFTLNPLSSKSSGVVSCSHDFLRAYFRGRSFPTNSSFDFHRRSWTSWIRRFTDFEVVVGLILANVAVFLLWHVADQDFMTKNFTISLDNFRTGRLHTLITSAFSHIRTEHIISNMIGLYFFGTNISRAFGPEFLLKLYLAGAVGGSVFYLVHHAFMAQTSSKDQRLWSMDPSRAPGLGASGAVNAIMLLDIFLFPKATLYFDFIFPVPAILLGIFLIGKDVLRIIEGDSHISGSAHLGGAAVAAIAWARIRKGRF